MSSKTILIFLIVAAVVLFAFTGFGILAKAVDYFKGENEAVNAMVTVELVDSSGNVVEKMSPMAAVVTTVKGKQVAKVRVTVEFTVEKSVEEYVYTVEVWAAADYKQVIPMRLLEGPPYGNVYTPPPYSPTPQPVEPAGGGKIGVCHPSGYIVVGKQHSSTRYEKVRLVFERNVGEVLAGLACPPSANINKLVSFYIVASVYVVDPASGVSDQAYSKPIQVTLLITESTGAGRTPPMYPVLQVVDIKVIST